MVGYLLGSSKLVSGSLDFDQSIGLSDESVEALVSPD
jgi:hypothetical protein